MRRLGCLCLFALPSGLVAQVRSPTPTEVARDSVGLAAVAVAVGDVLKATIAEAASDTVARAFTIEDDFPVQPPAWAALRASLLKTIHGRAPEARDSSKSFVMVRGVHRSGDTLIGHIDVGFSWLCGGAWKTTTTQHEFRQVGGQVTVSFQGEGLSTCYIPPGFTSDQQAAATWRPDSILLERSSCVSRMGCSGYRVILSATGRLSAARQTGEGVYARPVSDTMPWSILRSVSLAIFENDFTAWPSKFVCDVFVTHRETITIQVFGARPARVSHYMGCENRVRSTGSAATRDAYELPAELRTLSALADTIDRLTNAKRLLPPRP